jgi:hypothetical protein
MWHILAETEERAQKVLDSGGKRNSAALYTARR